MLLIEIIVLFISSILGIGFIASSIAINVIHYFAKCPNVKDEKCEKCQYKIIRRNCVHQMSILMNEGKDERYSQKLKY